MDSQNLFLSTKRVKEKIDLSVGIYDQRHKEIYKTLGTPLEEVITECAKTKKINVKKILECIDEIDKVRDIITVQDKASLFYLINITNQWMEEYVRGIPKKSREKYLDMEKSADNYYVVKDGIVLDKNSSDECELLIYAHNYLYSFAYHINVVDISEYDTAHRVTPHGTSLITRILENR